MKFDFRVPSSHLVLYLTTRSQREKCVRDNTDRDYRVPCVTCECDRKVLLVVTRVISAVRVRGALAHHIKGAIYDRVAD